MDKPDEKLFADLISYYVEWQAFSNEIENICLKRDRIATRIKLILDSNDPDYLESRNLDDSSLDMLVADWQSLTNRINDSRSTHQEAFVGYTITREKLEKYFVGEAHMFLCGEYVVHIRNGKIREIYKVEFP